MVGVVEAVVYHRRVTGWGERVAASRPQPGHCLNHPTTTLLQTTFQNTTSLTVVRSTTLSQPTNCSNLQFVNYIRWKHYIFSTIQTTTLLTVVRSTTSSQHWTVPTYIAQQFVNYIQWNQYSVQTTLSQPTLHYIQFVSTIQLFQPLQHVATIQVKWIKWEEKNYIVSKGGKCTINTNGNSVQSCECNLYNTRCSEWLSWVKFNGVGGCARAKHAWEEVKRWTLTCQQTRQSRALFEALRLHLELCRPPSKISCWKLFREFAAI